MLPSSIFRALIAVSALGLVLPARSQSVPVNTEIVIQEIKPGFVDTPKLSSGTYTKKSTGRPGQWLEVEVTFDRNAIPKAPKFSGDLVFTYYLLLKNEGVTEDRKPTLLTGSVTHVHVPQEKGLHAVAYVSPRTLAKFFDGKIPTNVPQTLVSVGVEVKDEGGLLAIKTWQGRLGGTPQAPVGWWTDGAAKYTAVPGFILGKDKTPFAPLEWDYFEQVKPQAGN